MKKLKLYKRVALLMIIFSSVTNNSFSQAETWLFSSNAGLIFNPAPVPFIDFIPNLNYLSSSATSSINDNTGKIILYSDGKNLWDENNVIITSSLNASTTSKSVLIVQKPDDCKTFFIFTTKLPGVSGTDAGLYITEVQRSTMGYNTVSLNQLLYSNCSGPIAGCFYNNAYWVLVHKTLTTEFVAFKITSTTSTGSLIPVISNVGTNIGQIDQLVLSPSYNKIAAATSFHSTIYSNYVGVYNFDKNTGVVSLTSSTLGENSNPQIQCSPLDGSQIQGIEFSPNENFLYAAVMHENASSVGVTPCNLDVSIIQFPITLAGWLTPNGFNTISQYNNCVAINSLIGMKLAPNGKIYIARNGCTTLGVINNPNAMGGFCMFNTTDIATALNTLNPTAKCGNIFPNITKGLAQTPCLENTCTPCTIQAIITNPNNAENLTLTSANTNLECGKNYDFNSVTLTCTPVNSAMIIKQIEVVNGVGNTPSWAASFASTGMLNIPANTTGFFYVKYVWGTSNSRCDSVNYPINITCASLPSVCIACKTLADATSQINITNNTNLLASQLIQSFSFTDLPPNITEVRATVEMGNIYAVDANGKKSDLCVKCTNNPITWGSLINGTGIAIPATVLINGIEQPLPYTPSQNQNPREITWANSGSMFSISSPLQLHFLLPPKSSFACCTIKASICVKFTFRNDKCEECSVIKCFETEVK